MYSVNIGFIAVVAITLLLLFYSGMLFDPELVRRQLAPPGLGDLGRLALANYLLIPLITLGIVRVFDFPPVLNLVLMAMAMLPCAAIVPPFVSMVGEAPERSLFVFIAMSFRSRQVGSRPDSHGEWFPAAAHGLVRNENTTRKTGSGRTQSRG